nr:Crp/Fnr family transcriptional regulator [Granulicella aggregans]
MDNSRPRSRSSPVEPSTILSFEQAKRSVVIGGSDLFSGLSQSERARISDLARPRSFLKGDTLFSQGQPFRKLILIESGCVKLTLLNRQGKEVILALRGVGDAVDLPIGTTHSTHSCSAQAVTRGHALTWMAADVEDMIVRLPQFTENMYLILHRHMHELEERYHESASDSVSRRLACTLIRLTEQIGIPNGEGAEIHISRYELAQMSGMTLFTVSRLISKWAKLGLIVPRREALVMLDSKRLDDLTSSGDPSVDDAAAAF